MEPLTDDETNENNLRHLACCDDRVTLSAMVQSHHVEAAAWAVAEIDRLRHQLADVTAERDRLRAELLQQPPTLEWLTESNPATEGFTTQLNVILDGMVESAREEAAKTEPWKELFAASEQGLQGLLSQAAHQCNGVILNLARVIEKRFGVSTSNDLYDLLKALPFAMLHLRNTIDDEQGGCCCADKARRIYYETVLAEIEAIRKRGEEADV